MKIKVIKNGQKAEFTLFVWKNMGTNKNGWKPIEGEDQTANIPQAPTNKGLQPATYKELVDSAKAYEKEDDISNALTNYRKAYDLKQTKPLKNKIEKLTALEAQIASYNELVKAGKEAMTEGESETALELFTQAKGVMQTDEIDSLITSATEMDLN